MTEQYWAVRIGRSSTHRGYFAADRQKTGWQPFLGTFQEARKYRKEVLSRCGHKDVYITKVTLAECKEPK